MEDFRNVEHLRVPHEVMVSSKCSGFVKLKLSQLVSQPKSRIQSLHPLVYAQSLRPHVCSNIY